MILSYLVTRTSITVKGLRSYMYNWVLDILSKDLTRPHDKVHTAVSYNHIADLPHFQPISSVLEWLLHLTAAKPAKIAFVRMRRAVRVQAGELPKLIRRAINLCFVST